MIGFQNIRRAGGSGSGGFTLVELVVVIAISAVLSTLVAGLITRPIEGYADLGRRADLVEAAESALRRVARDVRRGLPNSVRLRCDGAAPPCTGAETLWALELIHVVDGARYREGAGPGAGAPPCRLDFNNPAGDAEFGIPGGLRGGSPAAGTQLVIANWTATGPSANAYLGDNRTPASTTASVVSAPGTCNGEPRLQLSSAYAFPYRSQRQRLYLVDTPVTYLCNSTAGTLTRYANYPFRASQSDVDTAAELAGLGAQSALAADKVSKCRMTYAPGTSQRAGLLTLELAVSEAGEEIRLLHQIHVTNVP